MNGGDQTETYPSLEQRSCGKAESRSHTREVWLVEEIGNRSSAAFEELYSLYATPLFSYACKSLQDRQDAEEVLQDTFARLWDKASTYDPAKTKPFTWAMMILRGICIDRLRRNGAKSRARSVSLSDAPEPFTNRTLDCLHFQEMANRVTKALKTLPEDDQQCLELAIFGEISHQAIATQLNSPLGTVKTRIRRSLQTIRNLLHDHDA